MSLNADITRFRRDFILSFGVVEISDGSSTDILAFSKVPPATTGVEVRADDVADESEIDTDEEQLGLCEDSLQ